MPTPTPGVTSWEAANSLYQLIVGQFNGSAVGKPKEKIRIEPVEEPIPSKEPASAPVEVPEKVPA